ncbi:TPA: hypothetical protein JBF89_13220 [Legionella pneumophila]|nr:hypothetical protein [Legionella pneumophila]HAU0349925.1 hypothetical protein [Legionella pneumophila]HAU0353416.1 hypothetical protein [Legionella pneumophila]HAU0359505.1 hypothetical protein [Legionella pneumophila]HAU0368062.1 hypothetical protein [Legionella pneumophila]
MKHQQHKKTTLFLSAICLSGAMFASPANLDDLAVEAKYLGKSLQQLAKVNTKECCAMEVGYLGGMLAGSGILIQNNRIDFSKDSLDFVGRGLDRVSYRSGKCTNLSSMIPPYVERVARIIQDLQNVHNA